jgi:hypothetical protein
MAKRLVLFVEGEADARAVPLLVKRLVTELAAWDVVHLDEHAFKIGGIHNITGARRRAEWVDKLNAAIRTRDKLGSILLVLDGDSDTTVEGERFCAQRIARLFVERARSVGAGSVFSLACVFALQEYESWLLAGARSLAGKTLPDGRSGLRADATPPLGDLEVAPRDAKGTIGKLMGKQARRYQRNPRAQPALVPAL